MIRSSKFSDELGYFFTAATFLTRLPVSRWSIHTDNSLLRSSVYFPIVGICIGLICALAYSFTAKLWNENIAIVAALAAGIIATGAFHEDGFADVLDSMGAFDKDKKLQIMKDSRLGTYGVSGLILLLLLKFFALQSIVSIEQNIFIVFVIAHSLSRWCCLPLIYFNDYVSSNSKTGKDLIADATDQKRLLISSLITAMLIFLLCPAQLMIYLISGLIIIVLTTQSYFRRTIGGITGDCLGAANQIAEVMVYLVFAINVH